MPAAAFDSPYAEALFQRLSTRTARTGVIGLGYVGLPLAVEFGQAGFSVVGIDIDKRKCDAINAGTSYVADVPSSAVAALADAGRLHAVTDLGAAGRLDTINICVPTPLRKTRDPDMTYVLTAAQLVKEHLHPGMLVILESTTYPGTTEEVVRSILEESGLRAGSDFFLAFSPERVDPGNVKWNTKNVPKVVGGLTSDCSALAAELYGASIDRVVQVSSPRAAEMVKLLENTFRAINIGLVNEMALMCDRIGINIWEVIDAASTKPFGFMPFYPGPGLGGHCIPIDPFYLSWKVKEVGFEARFIELAGHVNAAMPRYVVDKIADALNEQGKSIKGANILVMGVAYKANVDDVRESPALDVITLLVKKGACVTYHDPFVPHMDAEYSGTGHRMDSVPYSRETVAAADCVVVTTDHQTFDYVELVQAARVIVDTRNAVKVSAPNVFKLGAPNPGA
ncbi:UDP-N-acetyl-D-glucosamine dehydrogenase [Mycolicibacterium moriokaense]|jgi:UDP-N-acetyl-D-glucosamine dehydrogenase|uniref:UDP-N-acetyl-D-glucosamine dehydrogenase n=2 Tax=Mycolicibacterium moriokaense TaxID=39691 RepID=A0AAD1MA56_9MYCO|nr:nucleotide sugar dehydrogenase [Mycolicibacterium moriokaense]ORB17605.1 UDP-N-acetyl-D-glucosamine dehydrogenase [Mycolicibacterium moriokaense]BBX05059.1 UDP-N-acetyl-D-glucosamine dehydrogenase [Mycolicibacterium moriokaense]